MSTVLEDPPILPPHRGAQTELWQVETLLRRGFGLLTIYSGDVSSDTNNKAMPHDSASDAAPISLDGSRCRIFLLDIVKYMNADPAHVFWWKERKVCRQESNLYRAAQQVPFSRLSYS